MTSYELESKLSMIFFLIVFLFAMSACNLLTVSPPPHCDTKMARLSLEWVGSVANEFSRGE